MSYRTRATREGLESEARPRADPGPGPCEFRPRGVDPGLTHAYTRVLYIPVVHTTGTLRLPPRAFPMHVPLGLRAATVYCRCLGLFRLFRLRACLTGSGIL
eukprot:scaffold88707_cov51-Phaeocystis_antarctica.AAC.1